jgi:hypothetical protein
MSTVPGIHGATPWWRRPVGRRPLLVVSLITLLVWSLTVGGAIWWVRAYVEAHLQVRDQTLMVHLPTGMKTNVDLRSKVHTRLEADPLLAVPINQTMKIRLPDKLNAHSVINTVVPVDTQFHYQADIPVDTVVSMNVPVVSWLPAMAIKLPIKVTIPLDMTVPVRTEIPLALDVRASAQASQSLSLPVHTTMHLRVPLRANIDAEVLSRTQSRLLGPVDPFALHIENARLTLPMSDMSWVKRAP